jgi:hypothetical protein
MHSFFTTLSPAVYFHPFRAITHVQHFRKFHNLHIPLATLEPNPVMFTILIVAPILVP